MIMNITELKIELKLIYCYHVEPVLLLTWKFAEQASYKTCKTDGGKTALELPQ